MMRSNWRAPPRPVLALAIAVACLSFAPGGAPAESAEVAARASLEEIRHWNQVGRAGEAEAAARASLIETERTYGPESAEVAEILDELAVSLRRGGKGGEPEALEVCERALRIKDRIFGVKDARYATSLYNLGLLRFGRKDYERALSMLEETLEIRRQALGSNHPDVAKSLLALGSVHHDLGNYAKGLALTERGVAIEETALGPANPERAQGLNSLAVAHYSTGDFSGSIPLYEEAIALWERSPTPNQGVIATCCHNLGAVYSDIGDHERAVRVLERALRIREKEFGANHLLVAHTLSVLGAALRGTGDLPRAKACYQRAVKILEIAAPRDSDLGWVRSKLGWVYLEEGDHARADEALRQALRELEAVLRPDHPDLWISLRGLAMVARNRGQVEAARGYYERTLELLRKSSGPRHPDLGRTLAEYASFQLATGDTLAAFDTALKASEINCEHLKLTARGITEQQALLYTATMETGLDVALAALSGTLASRSSDLVRRGWNALIRSRTLVLDEVAERARIVGGAGELLEGAKQLEGARNRLANLLVRESMGGPPERDRALVARAREEVERAEQELAARSATFRRGRDRATLGWDQVVSALPPGSALVSFASYGERGRRSVLAFVMGADRAPHVVALGSADQIDRLIARWRNLAGNPPEGGARDIARAEVACRKEGAALRARVWDPVVSVLSGARIVFVVPDGFLHLLNLAALPSPDAGYLIESPYMIHYVSAERDIVTAAGLPSLGAGLLAVGGASFDGQEVRKSPDPSRTVTLRGVPAQGSNVPRKALLNCENFRSVRFEPLPETISEINAVVELWGGLGETVVLEGDSAGERSVKELLPGKRVAHFATHGFFIDGLCRQPGAVGHTESRGIGGIGTSGTAPSAPRLGVNPFRLAGLALAGANRREKAGPDDEDGILTAEEIASLDLAGLDWAVLSACDTGIGDVRSGDGVLGLRRAFEVAGAGTLIMSLWAVEDKSAGEWMKRLYEGRFRKNLETAEAVREASLGMLKSFRAQGRGTHPFYWGGFVAVGGWR